MEKEIKIYGKKDKCKNDCRRILDVMKKEENKKKKGEIYIKIIDNKKMIGRIIGKGGKKIKSIMKEKDKKIKV
jgi:polyribonucleotide nucleotidyltransferase